MALTKRTIRRHQRKWHQVVDNIDNQLGNGGVAPTYYFEQLSNYFDLSGFFGKSQAGKKLDEVYSNLGYALWGTASEWCDEAREFMQSTHPWQNQTGNAEALINAEVGNIVDDHLNIYLYHGVWYGERLETGTDSTGFHYRNYQNYAIIEPTMRIKGPELLYRLHYALSGVSRLKSKKYRFKG